MTTKCKNLHKTASGITYACLRLTGHDGPHKNVGMTWPNEPLEEPPYAVYEDATGVLWTVAPPTKDNAEREAELAGPGHRAVTVELGAQLRNAFARGRRAGSE
jgi:hypothetical protein